MKKLLLMIMCSPHITLNENYSELTELLSHANHLMYKILNFMYQIRTELFSVIKNIISLKCNLEEPPIKDNAYSFKYGVIKEMF